MVTASSTRLPGVHPDEVRDIREFLRVLVERLEPDAVPLCEVTAMWTDFNLIERTAAAAETLLAGRVEEAGRWKGEGHRGAADQLALIAGNSVSAAKKQLETSKKVKKLPKTAKALRDGKLSPAKAEAIAAAAEIAPEAEDELLDGAEDQPLGKVLEKCQKARAKDRDAADKRIRESRSFKEFPDAEGAWNVRARGPLDAGAAFRAVHGPIVDEMFKAARAEGRREPYEAYAFDAFMELVRRAAEPTDEPVTTEKGAAPPKKARAKATPARYMGIIRADQSALQRGAVEGDEICEIAGLGPIPVSVARELLGDAVLKLVITKGVDVVNVTHLGRSATVAQQVALWWHSPGCEVLDCTHTWRIENDHHEDWADTHTTRLRKLKRLCEHHHNLKTYEGWAVLDGEGRQPMVPPDDPRHPKNKPRPPS